ncbi:MAG: AtpZ/AtpI family protein [Pseudonocardiaceae bacterium]|nr:MAG: AtpZ/AtpI family protein [Pseudonocardiaceae bacterium]
MDSNSPQGPTGPELGDLLSMGLTIALCVMAGFGLGWLVDRPFGTFPVFAFVGLFLGVAAAAGLVYRQFKRFQ